MAFTVSNAPNGWLVCDGTSYLRSGTYFNLFDAIGTAYGAADGLYFNVPDLCGLFLWGWANGSSNDPDRSSRCALTFGGNTGDSIGSYQADVYESHTHVSAAVNYVGYHWTDNTGPYAAANAAQGSTTAASGGNETRPQNVYVMFCIKY